MAVQVISFRCILKNKLGRLISSTINQNVLSGGSLEGEELPALSEALLELQKGECREVHLRAEDAYGFYNPKLVIKRRREDVREDHPGPLKNGQSISCFNNGKRNLFRVVELCSEFVTLDGNHPLAGQDLVFEIEAIDVRAATEEEIADSQTFSSSEDLLH